MAQQRVTVENIARVVNRAGGWLSRRDIALLLGRTKSTYINTTIERAVNARQIVKIHGDIDGRSGYVYGSHEIYQQYLKNR